MTTKEILENALEMYSGFMNFTDDDEEDAKEDKKKLRPLQMVIVHSKNTVEASITHLNKIVFEKIQMSPSLSKLALEDQTLRLILNDIIIHGINNMMSLRGIDPQGHIKKVKEKKVKQPKQ